MSSKDESATTDKMKMADGSTILRRNRPGTKSKVNTMGNLSLAELPVTLRIDRHNFLS